MTIEEAAEAFGCRVSHIEAVARGRKLKGEATLKVPTAYEVRRFHWIRHLEDQRLSISRRKLWGDGRLLWAVEHSKPT